MTEFDIIFADPLTTMVYGYASLAFVAAYAVAAFAFALTRRRSGNSRLDVSWSNERMMASPALAQLRGRYPA